MPVAVSASIWCSWRGRGFAVATLSHARHHARLAARGAEPVATVEAARYHAIVDTTGEAETLAPGLKANGHLVSILGRVAAWPNGAFAECWSLHEVALGALHRHGDDADWAELTAAGETMLAALATGTLLPEALRIGDFANLPAELEALRQRSFTGKALLRLGASAVSS